MGVHFFLRFCSSDLYLQVITWKKTHCPNGISRELHHPNMLRFLRRVHKKYIFVSAAVACIYGLVVLKHSSNDVRLTDYNYILQGRKHIISCQNSWKYLTNICPLFYWLEMILIGWKSILSKWKGLIICKIFPHGSYW